MMRNEIKERFYTELSFGTAGLRGIIGAGINRMNMYTVRKATQGLANYILKAGGKDKGVAIAFDSRQNVSGVCAMMRHYAWRPTGSGRMCLNLCGRHRSFPMQ